MRQSGFLKKMESGIHQTGRIALYCSAGFMLVMLLVVVVDVVARVARVPLKGSYDLGEILMACITYTAIAYTQYEKGHVRVDIVLGRLPRRVAMALDALTLLASTAVALLIAWAMGGRVLGIITSPNPGPVSPLLEWPLYPFYIIVMLGSLLLGLELLIDAIRSGVHAARGGDLVTPITGGL